ncbi:MFS transporter [Streptomyces turgidiscabies]|uniref:Transporter, major facilitator family protein n=1 Tax=Streptomyces turgidiscabies (strain Car8) TaxID=698760 RepID=L7EVH9_STRT8|nr:MULTISPECIES: MFS transporter [Streptomyces]ELP63037.1 transporter, major facilitator family protein [Streptomyces turgidiscabies Car8]MDX3496598.1 MFS transporter [Streptomyces turgidiscabies]GAQ72794.1 major myo-inositol transporter IolT [Streptomyces turgidiscabies]
MAEPTKTSPLLDRRHWMLAVAAGMASFLDSGAIISVGLGLALWKESFGLSVWTVGVLGSALTLFIAVGALTGGRLADLVGRGRVFSLTILLYAVAALAVACAPNAAVLVAGVVVIGVAAGADLPTSIAVLSERAPDGTQGRLVAFTHVMWTAGVVVTTLLGFAVSGLGTFGIRLIFVILAVLAVGTFVFRAFYPAFRDLEAEAEDRHTAKGVDASQALPLSALFRDRNFAGMIITTALFYLFFTLVANTFGSFKTYFLVTVGGTSQTTATALSFCTTLVGLAGTIVFTRIADTKWRSRFFGAGVVVFTACQLLIAVTGGSILPAMIAALVLYNLAFPFIGEALYKVWTQESFPVNARATVQGATMAVARFAAAGFALVTPALIDWSPSGLFSLLALFALTSGAIGMLIIRRSRTPREAHTAPSALSTPVAGDAR